MKAYWHLLGSLRIGLLAGAFLFASTYQAYAQDSSPQPVESEVTREGAWEYIRGEGLTARRTLTLVPKAEVKPALSVQFFPNSFNSKSGNAAVYYLKAGGFFEQTPSLQAKRKFEEDSRKAAKDENYPPLVWLETELKDLPVDKVKEYLGYTAFQPRFLEEAAARRLCDFDRQIKTVDNPMGYLLPEIQAIRETARMQALRFLVAMSEDRTDDAIKILGQIFAMGPHLSQEPFLVSTLVGAACVGIGWQQAFYLSEHPNAPNLYWAIATLPRPLINLEHSLAYEREFLFEQVKELREVDDQPKPDGYWSEFIDRYMQSTRDMQTDLLKSSLYGKAGFTLAIGANVAKAREYLIEVEGVTAEKLDSLPNTQIFFLAVRKFYERFRDEEFKSCFLPEGFARKSWPKPTDFTELNRRYGLLTAPTAEFLAAVQAVKAVAQRKQQEFALWQTIESIRHHLATHDNQLPNSLADLELPAPYDPLTNQPFEYLLHAAGATLKGSPNPGLRYEFELRNTKSTP